MQAQRLLLLLLCSLTLLCTCVRAQELSEVSTTLLTGVSQEAPLDILTDAEANVYLAVSHYLDFVYAPDEAPLPGGPGRSAAVVKRNAVGKTVWAYSAQYADAGDCSDGPGLSCFGGLDLLALRPNGQGVFAAGDFNLPTDLDNGEGQELVGDEKVGTLPIVIRR